MVSRYCSGFKVQTDGRELCISKEGLMELVDYDREEVIRLEEVHVIYFLPLFRKMPPSFILFSGLQLWARS